MRAGEGGMGSHETDRPDGNAAGCERIAGPVPVQIAWVLTYLLYGCMRIYKELQEC